jgi:hypothetical protein
LLEENYGTQIADYKNNRTASGVGGTIGGAALVAVIVFCWWHPAAWVVAGGAVAGGISGGAAGVRLHRKFDGERRKALDKKERVRECKGSLSFNFPVLILCLGLNTMCRKSHLTLTL